MKMVLVIDVINDRKGVVERFGNSIQLLGDTYDVNWKAVPLPKYLFGLTYRIDGEGVRKQCSSDYNQGWNDCLNLITSGGELKLWNPDGASISEILDVNIPEALKEIEE